MGVSGHHLTLGIWYRRGKILLLVLMLALALRCSAAELTQVSGGSMAPTLHDGDWLLTNKLAYGLRLPGTHSWPLRWSGPRRGDVVVLSCPVDGRRLVKRVAGVPGDRCGGGVVPSGHYFVLGEAAGSRDSRAFGCVPRERILGRVVGVVFAGAAPSPPSPLSHQGERGSRSALAPLCPWWERGWG